VRLSRSLLGAVFEDHTQASITADMAIRAEAQHALAALGFFDPAAEADVNRQLDDVVEGLRTVEGLEEGRLAGHVSNGYASADFARLVEGAVKAKLEAEAKGLIRARLVGKMAPQDDFDRFAANATATVETALGIVYGAVREKWKAVARVDVAGKENYVHMFEKLPRGLKVHKREEVHYLRYEVGDVMYGDARAEGVVVLVFLGGEKTVRVEVLAKSVVYVPARFEEVEWSGERRLRLATARINKPSGVKKYVAHIEPRLEKLEADVRGGAASVDGIRGLLVTDASGKKIGTPDPLLIKLFTYPFKRVRIEVVGVSHTQTGPALQFRAVALDNGPFEKLFGDIAKKYEKDLWEVVDNAKRAWLETLYKLRHDINRVADEATKVGRRNGVEAGRKLLVEGLRRLFKEKEERAASNYEALEIAVAGRLLLDIVNSPREWLSLLVGDGVVDIPIKTLGFSAKYAEVAKAVLRLLAVWAGAYGARTRGMGEREAVYASTVDVTKILGAVLAGEVLEYATALAKSWTGLAGSDAPKLISLLALAQLLGVVEGKWAVELWLAHKADTTPVKPEVAKALEGLFARVEGVDKVKWTEGGISLYFRLRGVEGAGQAAVFKLYTNFANFYLYCESCSEASAGRVLSAIAEELRLAVERLKQTAEEERPSWPKWAYNALSLPADVGWPMFLKLWARHNTSLSVPKEGRELLRVELLEARPNGIAKFRLWFYKWRETRPDIPYVDFEIRSYRDKGGRINFRGYVYANTKEILREHLHEIAELLKRYGVEGVAYYDQGHKGAFLRFSNTFRYSVLGRLGISPEFPQGEPVAVQHFGGFRFKIGDKEVKFGVKVMGRYEFYAELRLSSNEEAVCYASSLRAIGVDSRAVGNSVRLDSDSFFGLLAVANAVPPGLMPLYRSEDLHVYAGAEGGRMRLYFAVRHEGVWRVAEGMYGEKYIRLIRAERDVLEAIRGAVVKALERLGHPADIGEPREVKDEERDVVGYYLQLYSHHLAPFLKYAAEGVKAGSAKVSLEGRRIVVSAGGVEVAVEFKLLKHGEAVFFMAQDVGQTLVLYKSLKAMGVPVEITPRGVKVNSEALWSLMAATVERDTPNGLPAEVMPGTKLLNMHSADGMKLYIFRAEGAHYYFAVKTGQGWRAAGGKYDGKQVTIRGKAAEPVAKAINTIYRERGVNRKMEVKYDKCYNAPYIKLTNEDLGLLGLRRHEP